MTAGEVVIASANRTIKITGSIAFPSANRPSPLSPVGWLARGFNAAMHVRNALIRPPFVMFYLRYLLPEVLDDLRQAGLVPAVSSPFSPPFQEFRLVVATRPV